MLLADQFLVFLREATPFVIWLWLISSIAGLIYALRLWVRSLADVRRQYDGPTTAVLTYVAWSNRKRVEVRVWMFAGFVVVGLCSAALTVVPSGLLRGLVQFLYIVTFMAVNFLTAFNSYRDEKRDRVLQTMLRRDEQLPIPPELRQ